MNLTAWAIQWSVPLAALQDLERQLGTDPTPISTPGLSESAIQNAVRLEAAQKGVRLYRNNVGALMDESGRLVRYGLANDTKALNKTIASADLIGWRPVLIGPQHVGHTIGQFVSREIKEAGWSYSGQGREAAQKAWALLVAAGGGDAGFAAGVGTL